MRRPFSTKEAKNLIDEHNRLMGRAKYALVYAKQYPEQVVNVARQMAMESIMYRLSAISVDEINRDKKGIRVKTLKDNGIYTIADVINANHYQLAAINGISDEMASQIKSIADDITLQLSDEGKIKLNMDNRTRLADNLVVAVYKYMQSMPLIQKVNNISTSMNQTVDNAIKNVLPAIGVLKWLFLSGEKKQKATEAYQFLKKLMTTEYAYMLNNSLCAVEALRGVEPNEAWEEFGKNPIGFLNVLEKLVPQYVGNSEEKQEQLLSDEVVKDINECAQYDLNGLNCQLRRYQEWGVKYILHQKRVLLGDEMGLGKTIQALASMVALKNAGHTHFFVICPASVIVNWCREISKHSDLSAVKIHGKDREEAFAKWIDEGGVAVTNYETTEHIVFPQNLNIGMIVVDEAHYIKNPTAQRTVNVTRLCRQSERLLFMTGTALENRVEEMIALIEKLRPDVSSQIKEVAVISASLRFRQLIAPVYLRRKREDVLTELPDLIELEEWCDMSEAEEQAYNSAVLLRNYAEVRQLSWNVPCVGQSVKAQRLLEIVEDAEEEGRKVLVFSFFLDTLSKVQELLKDRCLTPIQGKVSAEERQLIIDEFNAAPAGTVMAAQIIAGGMGLNIQAASVVVICEPQLKPSIENQAISRAYRMGQTRNVIVHRLLCENTVEERIMQILKEKQIVFDAFADEAVAADEEYQIDDKTFGTIINQEIVRITQENDMERQ